MRVRIAYTVEVYAAFRRAINRYHGREGLATHKQVLEWYREFGHSMDDILMEGGEDL